MEDYEMVEADNIKLNVKIQEVKDELDYAMEFVKNGGLITADILKGIKKRLK